jgi:hypothetical protein
MTSIKEWFVGVLKFIFVSSGNPTKASASLKFALVGFIPYIMQALDLVCGLGNQCYDINPTLLETFFDAIANGAFYLLSFIAVVGTAWQAWLKIYRTITGKNLALK